MIAAHRKAEEMSPACPHIQPTAAADTWQCLTLLGGAIRNKGASVYLCQLLQRKMDPLIWTEVLRVFAFRSLKATIEMVEQVNLKQFMMFTPKEYLCVKQQPE